MCIAHNECYGRYKLAQHASEKLKKKSLPYGEGSLWVLLLTLEEQMSLGTSRKEYNKYLHLGLNNKRAREAWLVADDARGSRKAIYKKLRPALNDYMRLYKLAIRQKTKY
jgi:hypothetical protein